MDFKDSKAKLKEILDNKNLTYRDFILELILLYMDIDNITANLRWIPVSERLPHKGEYGKVLVTYIPSGGTLWTTVIIAHYSDLMGIAKPSFHIGEFGKESFQNITEQVIAWMPLPKPYKAESEEKDAL